MPKRRRIYTPLRNKAKVNVSVTREPIVVKVKEKVVPLEATTPRGRLKGALLDVLEPAQEESDESVDASPTKRERRVSVDRNDVSDDDDRAFSRRSPPRQSYVLKLFDRSVDLSQFNEDSPLYPICRAWIANQPKANYKRFGRVYEEPELPEDSVELPGPEGPPVSRIPELLPEQLAANKVNINLNDRSAPPPSRSELLRGHVRRWGGVRRAWLQQARALEARYHHTQHVLNNINVNAL